MRVGAHPGARLRHHQPDVGDVVDQVAVGGRVGAVRAAGEHGDRRAPAGERAAVRGLVDAERRPRDDAPRLTGQRGRDPGRDIGAVRRGRARADHCDGLLGGLVQPQRTATPQTHGTPPRSCRCGAWARSSRPVGHSASPGTTNRIPIAAARSSSLAGSVDSSRSARSAPSSLSAAWSRRLASTRLPPSSWTRSVSLGSPGSPIRDSTTRASRSRSSGPVTPTPTGSPRASPARCSAAAGSPSAAAGPRRASSIPGRATPARSATDHATRWTRTAPRRVSRPAYTSMSRRERRRIGQRPLVPQRRSRDVGVQPPGHPGVALPLTQPGRRDAHPDRRTRLGPVERQVLGATLLRAERLDEPGDVDPVGDRDRRSWRGTRGASPPGRCSGGRASRGGTPRRDTGFWANTNIVRAG